MGEGCSSEITSHSQLGSMYSINSGGVLAQQDHIVRVARQLLWSEELSFRIVFNQRILAKAPMIAPMTKANHAV